MRALITGIGGFAGQHLAARLLARGHEVSGTVRPGGSRPTDPQIKIIAADIEDAESVANAVTAAQPTALFHLAGLTFVPQSLRDPTAAMRANVLGAIYVLAAVRDAAPSCRVLVVGSGDAYGRVEPSDLPITETCPWRPLSPYGVSKAAADLVAYQWSQPPGLDIVRVRPFNHTGPGQRSAFVCADFARQLVAIERGLQPPRLSVGNLEAIRDFSDVRDIADGYIAACEHGERGEAYNLCSGVGRSIRSVLEDLIAMSGVSVEMVVDAAKLRPIDVPQLVGCGAKVQVATGWCVTIPWRQTLANVLTDWRARPDAQLS
ncbi:MAG: GDP-mannose 4,6-dehydratase [Deltaproteobacteria bacterium]|nr:GDP-mannose 4,6-dehydratase [Deltaproteobacteria bacterium]MBI3388269.1 GDP-mannose 4,6-dehydratase [Deltaproteobacteria bacterium]